MDQERYDNLSQMISGIAKRASNTLYSRSQEDIEQDLWVKVLETEERKGHEMDLNLAAKVCWDYVNDMKDYDQRRNHFATDFSGTGDEETEFDNTDFIGAKADKGEYSEKMNIDDLYNMFPEGSKERLWLDFWGTESNVRPSKSALPPSARKNDGFTEDALAKMLGYAGQSSGGYKKFRGRMKDMIADYFRGNPIDQYLKD